MTVNEVVEKLSMEMALALGELDHLGTCRRYIRMALAVGIEHYTKDMEEIVAMNLNGEEVGRFKSATDCAEKLGIPQSYVSTVLTGIQHSSGGFMFIKSKDRELIQCKKIA